MLTMKYIIFSAVILFSSAAFAQNSSKSDANIIFNETFEDNANNWPTSTIGPAVYMIVKGAYVMENTDDKDCLVTIPVNNPMSDFVVSVNAEHISGKQNVGYGLFFGGSDNTNGYVFEIAATGFYKIYRYTHNVYEELVPWTANTEIAKGDSRLNIIKIKVSEKKNSMTFYINDTYLKSISSFKVFGSKLGFTKSKNQRVKFDNLELQKKDAFIELSEYLFDSSNLNRDDVWGGNLKTINKDTLKVFHTDNFSGKVYGWSYDTLHTKISNDKMITTSEKDQDWSAEKSINPDLSFDYAVAIDTKHIAGTQTSPYGITIGGEQNKDDISFFIANNGFFIILHGDSAICKWTKNENINMGENSLNHLDIYKSKTAYSFYANGKLLYTYTFNPDFKYRRLHVLLEVTQAQTIEFDNFTVRGVYKQPMYVD